jgi:hypothetical protein
MLCRTRAKKSSLSEFFQAARVFGRFGENPTAECCYLRHVRCCFGADDPIGIGHRQRLSETAPDLAFRKQFEWRPPMVNVAVDFGADEAVQRYRIDTITPCACRD